jgi:hypothetical protein
LIRAVLSGDGDPVKGDLGQVVGHAGNGGDVPQLGTTPLPVLEINDLDTTAIGADEDVVAIQDQV